MKTLMALFVCVALVRAVNGAGALSVTDLLADLQTFEFDMQHISELMSLFREGTLADSLYEWNYNLTGIDGFFVNLGKSLSGFFGMIGLLIKSLVMSLWDVLLSAINLLVHVLTIVCNVLGFRFGEI